MDANLRREVESLRKLKAKQLKLRYRELFQEDSRSSNQQYLFRRIAWRLQALARLKHFVAQSDYNSMILQEAVGLSAKM